MNKVIFGLGIIFLTNVVLAETSCEILVYDVNGQKLETTVTGETPMEVHILPNFTLAASEEEVQRYLEENTPEGTDLGDDNKILENYVNVMHGTYSLLVEGESERNEDNEVESLGLISVGVHKLDKVLSAENGAIPVAGAGSEEPVKTLGIHYVEIGAEGSYKTIMVQCKHK